MCSGGRAAKRKASEKDAVGINLNGRCIAATPSKIAIGLAFLFRCKLWLIPAAWQKMRVNQGQELMIAGFTTFCSVGTGR